MKRHYIPVTADVPGISEATRSFLRKVIRTALTAQGVDFPCEVDVLITGDAGIHAINLDMRGVDRPTDVLSVPEFELTPGQLPGAEDADPGTGYVPLGGYGHLHGAGEGAGQGIRPLQPPGAGVSGGTLRTASAGLRPHGRGRAEGADARARGGHHVPAGSGEIVKIAQMKES